MKKALEAGDYVLATKYDDGDPHDQWCVGFYRDMTHHGRYNAVDSEGQLFRGNGFRRAAKISAARGQFILDNGETIQWAGRSLWWWKRRKMEAPL